MNSGVFPGIQLSGEPIEGNKVALEVVTTSGVYVTKGVNLEIQLLGAGASGGSQQAGGNAGAEAIKRIIGLPIGTAIAVVIGNGGVYSNGASDGSASMCSIPGYSQIICNGGIANGPSATAVGGDINIGGLVAGGLDQNGYGGFGAPTSFGPGGPTGSPGVNGIGYGTGGGTGSQAGSTGGSGAKGAMIIRYF